ncbi:family A G protein-coupled receptor-like protein [Mytilinidion resinicola]|uniref:Family A G protein-coupled receptor-like protein n=1 Tax=Mytilinidion resinicola TaxID=574789 RepID=A0A6A6Z569_9PEZI|nr:family A G protein-coupled receptor-like protein [Mytilinidion resinicola]KAF2815879.1 family A G protein-coupled receptor-like protein [Mytilinidion resinicola]
MWTIVVAERVGSVLSIIGSLFIVVTFAWKDSFKKPINRMIFFASFGNVLANTATMFSTSVLELDHSTGRPTSACRAQGFLIQSFIPSDALWAACMAWNVYITFFGHHTPQSLQKFEMRYIAICYGLPLTVSLSFLVADSRTQEPIYGPATIWCWVTRDYDWMRLAFFYGPVLAIITATFMLYAIVFVRYIRTNARALQNIETPLPLYNFGLGFVNSNLQDFSEIQAVTNIDVTTETKRARSDETTLSSFTSTTPLTSYAAEQHGARDTHTAEDIQPMHNIVISGGQTLTPAEQAAKNARTYLLTAALVWLVLLVVWVPSTINRIQGMITPSTPNYGMNLAAAIVLPLQGLGNAIIYGVTSRHEIKDIFFRRRSRDRA